MSRNKTLLVASIALFACSAEVASAGTDDRTINGEVSIRTAELKGGREVSMEPSWTTAGEPADLLIAFSPNDHHREKEFCMKPSLTDEQLKRMIALKDQYRINTATKKAELMSLHHNMGDLLGQASIDKQGVKDVFSKISAIQNDLAQQHLKFVLDSAEILTAEQREEIHKGMLRHHAVGGMPFPPPPPAPHMMPFGMGDELGPPIGPFGGPPPFGLPPMMGFGIGPGPGMGPMQGPPPHGRFGKPPAGPHGERPPEDFNDGPEGVKGAPR
jgi:Spy/CpxP family protein refolding chaperone